MKAELEMLTAFHPADLTDLAAPTKEDNNESAS